MKRTTIVLLFILSSGGLLSADPVYFADAYLKAAVEAELGISNPDPCDMLLLTSLGAYNKGITDLTGLEYAKNLTLLYLTTNQISDLSPLSGLTKLETLSMHGNQISDISALSGLTNLDFLHLGWNQISDISAVSSMTKLTTLRLIRNSITDVSPLAGLTNLDALVLSNNLINDISDLSGLTKLTNLKVDINPISDISALEGMNELVLLHLNNDLISDISPLLGMTKLLFLKLSGNPLNEDACNIYIPQIQENNPDITIDYDGCTSTDYTLFISSTEGGYVQTPGEGYFQYDQGAIVYIVAQVENDYHFVNWTGSAVDAGKVANPNAVSTTVTMHANYTLQANFELIVQGPMVSTLPASDVGAVTATLWGQIDDDDGEACEYRFRYMKEDDSYSYTSWTGSVTTGESFSQSINGLDPNSSYCFNAQARNSAYDSDWGNEECFYTTDYDRIPAGTDYWATPDAQIQFGDGDITAIPADFFGPGSDPFDGLITFRGEPIEPNESLADTIIERLEDAILKDPPDPIEIEMIDLNLLSTSPIIVTYNNGAGGESFFDVFMTIDPNSPSYGQMTIDGDAYGGEFWFDIDANIKFVFAPVGGGQEFSLIQPVTLTSEELYPWQNSPPIIVVRPPCIDSDFYPSGDGELTLQIGAGDSFQNITHKDPLPMDFDDDGDVDLEDFAIFSRRWLVGK